MEGTGLMQKTINHLIQLQELVIARAEQEAAQDTAKLSHLDEAIDAMLQELPYDVRTQFQRLEKRGVVAIVPISNHKVCSACGMALPVSFVQAVKSADKIHLCPNCARMLFYPLSQPRHMGGGPHKRREPPKVGIERFSAPDLMVPELASNGRDEVIGELCHLLEEKHFVDNGQRLMEEALKREAIVSTAVDHGLAFPHVRGVEGGGLTLALGLNKKGIKFGGNTRTLTRVVFFMVIPTAASAFYLKLLSGLTQTFRNEDAREKLFDADTPEALWKALLKTTKSTIQ